MLDGRLKLRKKEKKWNKKEKKKEKDIVNRE